MLLLATNPFIAGGMQSNMTSKCLSLQRSNMYVPASILTFSPFDTRVNGTCDSERLHLLQGGLKSTLHEKLLHGALVFGREIWLTDLVYSRYLQYKAVSLENTYRLLVFYGRLLRVGS